MDTLKEKYLRPGRKIADQAAIEKASIEKAVAKDE